MTVADTPEPIEWHPARLLQIRDNAPDFALIILNQPLRNGASLRSLWKNSTWRIAADGGANRLHELSSFRGKFANLHAIIGDLDSLNPSVRDFYTSQPTPAQVIHDKDQESTDFGKAINWIRKQYSDKLHDGTDEKAAHGQKGIDIVALGGIGGRIDQGLSQLHHLYLFQQDPTYADGRVYLLSGSSITFLLKSGSHRIYVKEDDDDDEDDSGRSRGASSRSSVFGKHVGIIPLKEPSRISTKGLEWDVSDWETQMGGRISTSNHVLPETRVVEISTTKDVLFTIALGKSEGEDDA